MFKLLVFVCVWRVSSVMGDVAATAKVINVTVSPESGHGTTFGPLPSAPGGQIDWCVTDMQCPVGSERKSNTMCKYTSMDVPGEACTEFAVSKAKAPESILVIHNNFRLSVTVGGVPGWPTAARMLRLTYDPLLEQMAVRWAAQCDTELYHCWKAPAYSVVGYNIFVDYADKQSDSFDLLTPFKSWTAQNTSLTSKNIGDYKFDKSTANFAQLIYSETKSIGCADVVYAARGGPKKYRRVYLCLYGPGFASGASSESVKLYEVGPPCSKCVKKEECFCSDSRHTNASPRPAPEAFIFLAAITLSMLFTIHLRTPSLP